MLSKITSPYVKIIYRCPKCDTRIDHYQEYCDLKSCVDKSGNQIAMVEHPVYNLNELVKNFDCFTYVLLNVRDCGKSHQVAKRIVDKYYKFEMRAIMLKRYEKLEFKHALDIFHIFNWCSNPTGAFVCETHNKENGKKSGKSKKNCVIKEYTVFLFSIYNVGGLRGSQFKNLNVTTIWWDEYANENGAHYKKEDEWVQSLIETVFRRRTDVEFFVTSNLVNKYLPLFNYFQINWENEFSYDWKRRIVTHIIPASLFPQPVGAVAEYSKNTSYYEYAYTDNALFQEEMFIEKSKISVLPVYKIIKLYLEKNLIVIKEYQRFLVLDYAETNQNTNWICVDKYNSLHSHKPIDTLLTSQLVNRFNKKEVLFTTPSIKEQFILFYKDNAK